MMVELVRRRDGAPSLTRIAKGSVPAGCHKEADRPEGIRHAKRKLRPASRSRARNARDDRGNIG